jgi:leucine-rich repeat protein SHOC2
MTQEELAAVIEQAKQDRSTSLDLSWSKLNNLPASIGNLIDLVRLDLSNNSLSSLPASIKNLEKLSWLDLGSNEFNIFPKSICDITNLYFLSIERNHIQNIPESIESLQYLNYLYINDNKLHSLPNMICSLPCLKSLNLHDNKILKLPDKILNLSSLEFLDLDRNQISHFANSIGDMNKLKTLSVRENLLRELPSRINRLSNLEYIKLDDNPLTDLSILQSLPVLKTVELFDVYLPHRYWIKFSDWNPEWLLDEENAEIRRTLIDRVGYEKICEKLGAIEIDFWREYHLITIPADVDVEPIFLLKMTCPSTNHIHVLRVPPTMTSAEAAITWINHGIHPDDFAVQT